MGIAGDNIGKAAHRNRGGTVIHLSQPWVTDILLAEKVLHLGGLLGRIGTEQEVHLEIS